MGPILAGCVSTEIGYVQKHVQVYTELLATT